MNLSSRSLQCPPGQKMMGMGQHTSQTASFTPAVPVGQTTSAGQLPSAMSLHVPTHPRPKRVGCGYLDACESEDQPESAIPAPRPRAASPTLSKAALSMSHQTQLQQQAVQQQQPVACRMRRNPTAERNPLVGQVSPRYPTRAATPSPPPLRSSGHLHMASHHREPRSVSQNAASFVFNVAPPVQAPASTEGRAT